VCAIDIFAQQKLRAADARIALPVTFIEDIRDVSRLATRITYYLFKTASVHCSAIILQYNCFSHYHGYTGKQCAFSTARRNRRLPFTNV
jgi:hypothetical protein